MEIHPDTLRFLDADIRTALTSFLADVDLTDRFIPLTVPETKIPSRLVALLYVRGATFIECAVKHHIYNVHICKGMTKVQENELETRLNGFRTPSYTEIKMLYQNEFSFDIQPIFSPYPRVLSCLDEIVKHRHRHAHGTPDILQFLNAYNLRTIEDFKKDFPGAIEFTSHLCRVVYDSPSSSIKYLTV
jgi:hypothetical protein